MPDRQGPKPPERGVRARTQAPHPAPLQGSSREASPPNTNHSAERDGVFVSLSEINVKETVAAKDTLRPGALFAACLFMSQFPTCCRAAAPDAKCQKRPKCAAAKERSPSRRPRALSRFNKTPQRHSVEPSYFLPQAVLHTLCLRVCQLESARSNNEAAARSAATPTPKQCAHVARPPRHRNLAR